MEKGYVVQGEVYAEPVLEAEVVTAEPIMGEVVGEVVPSATDHLPEALDGAPRLALVAAGSADALRFDHADVLRAGGEAPLSANGKNVGLYWSQPRNAWGHWDYIDLGVTDRAQPLHVKLDGPYVVWNGQHGEMVFDVAMWKLHEGTHLVAVKEHARGEVLASADQRVIGGPHRWFCLAGHLTTQYPEAWIVAPYDLKSERVQPCD